MDNLAKSPINRSKLFTIGLASMLKTADNPNRSVRAPRFSAHRTAQIVLDRGETLVKCSIRNISETGVALALPPATHVPRSFDLLFETDARDEKLKSVWAIERKMSLRRCQVVWRNGFQLGVKFV